MVKVVRTDCKSSKNGPLKLVVPAKSYPFHRKEQSSEVKLPARKGEERMIKILLVDDHEMVRMACLPTCKFSPTWK